jgi:tetratricopeptide (TPR) repeat protein
MNPTRRFASPRICLIAALVAASLALASCAPAPKTLSPREFEVQWHDLLAQRSYPAAEKLIKGRERQLPNDPEALIARANLYFRQATGPGAGFGAGGRAGAAAGDSAGLDTVLAQRAIDTLRDGIKRFPNRLDIRMGLAFVCRQLGMRSAEVQLIGELIAYARDHGDSLRWSYGEPLPMPARKYVPQLLHESVRYYTDRGAPGDDQVMMAIAQMVMQAYPESPLAPNDVGYWFANHNQWARSLEFLERAERADSTDALVLYNLGWANEQLRRRDPAIHYYRRSLSLGTAGSNADIARSASGRLAALGATP